MKNSIIMYTKKIINNQYIIKKISTFIYNFKVIFKRKNKIESNIYDYKTIIENKRFFCNEVYKANSFYGIGHSLRNYSNYKKKIEACIEHGVYFGDYLNENETTNSGIPALITFGEKRKQLLQSKNCKKNIFEIGPYIYYSDVLLTNEELIKEKKKNGKTLLVFPSHSIDNSNTNFDYEDFINEIEKIKSDYDYKTVIVCMYYRDIELGREEVYLNKGYKIATAGRREDENFLARQKTLILLSDYTLSNSVGTHVGYSIILDKPHTIIRQEIKHETINEKGEKDIENTKLESYKIQKNEVYKVFSKYNETITDEQVNICNIYWGLDKIKSSEELNKIFVFCENVAKKSNHKEEKFNKVSKEIYKDLDRNTQKLISESISKI